MQKKETKKSALINLALLFYMRNNTNKKDLLNLAAHLIGEIMADHKLTDNDKRFDSAKTDAQEFFECNNCKAATGGGTCNSDAQGSR